MMTDSCVAGTADTFLFSFQSGALVSYRSSGKIINAELSRDQSPEPGHSHLPLALLSIITLFTNPE